MQITKPLSVKLQGRGEEIHCAVNRVKDCIAVMQQIRDDDTFDAAFQAATEICGEEITMPRLTARQRNRTNVPATNAAVYNRRAVFLPFVDCCIVQMTERFTPHAATANHLIECYQRTATPVTSATLHQWAASMPSFFLAETSRHYEWNLCAGSSCGSDKARRLPDHSLQLRHCAWPVNSARIQLVLLQIYATLPVTTATGERSFSALKYLKNYLWSMMGEERLMALLICT